MLKVIKLWKTRGPGKLEVIGLLIDHSSLLQVRSMQKPLDFGRTLPIFANWEMLSPRPLLCGMSQDFFAFPDCILSRTQRSFRQSFMPCSLHGSTIATRSTLNEPWRPLRSFNGSIKQQCNNYCYIPVCSFDSSTLWAALVVNLKDLKTRLR